MNQELTLRLEGIREMMIAAANANALLPNAAKGYEREIFIREYLGQVFPPHFRVGCGAIIDPTGNRSGQVDVVIELPFFPSFPVPSAGNGRLYLAEGVAAAIEVKSDLAKQWGQVERKVRSVNLLRRKFDIAIGIITEEPSVIPTLIVGYSGFSTPEAVVDRVLKTPEEARPDAVLLLSDPGVLVRRDVPDSIALSAEALFLFVEMLNHFLTSTFTPGARLGHYLNDTRD